MVAHYPDPFWRLGSVVFCLRLVFMATSRATVSVLAQQQWPPVTASRTIKFRHWVGGPARPLCHTFGLLQRRCHNSLSSWLQLLHLDCHYASDVISFLCASIDRLGSLGLSSNAGVRLAQFDWSYSGCAVLFRAVDIKLWMATSGSALFTGHLSWNPDFYSGMTVLSSCGWLQVCSRLMGMYAPVLSCQRQALGWCLEGFGRSQSLSHPACRARSGGCCSQGCHGYPTCPALVLEAPLSFQAPSPSSSIVDEFKCG